MERAEFTCWCFAFLIRLKTGVSSAQIRHRVGESPTRGTPIFWGSILSRIYRLIGPLAARKVRGETTASVNNVKRVLESELQTQG